MSCLYQAPPEATRPRTAPVQSVDDASTGRDPKVVAAMWCNDGGASTWPVKPAHSSEDEEKAMKRWFLPCYFSFDRMGIATTAISFHLF